MSKNNNLLVINNKRYDAKTGQLLSGVTHSTHVKHLPATDVAPVVKTVKAGRKPAKHVAAHTPKSSQTLMRKAVRKPSASLKRRIRVQTNLGSLSEQPRIAGPTPIHADTKRQQLAARKRKSQLISHFSANLAAAQATPVTATKPAPVSQPRPLATATIRKKPQTTAELLEYALQQANSHQQQSPQKQHRKLFKRRAHAHSL